MALKPPDLFFNPKSTIRLFGYFLIKQVFLIKVAGKCICISYYCMKVFYLKKACLTPHSGLVLVCGLNQFHFEEFLLTH